MKLRLTTRIVLFFTLLAAVLLTTVGVLSYRSGSESVQEAVVSDVVGKAIEKDAALDTWFEERMADLRQLADGGYLVGAIEALMAAAPGSDEARSARELILRGLKPHLDGAGSGMIELFVIESEGGKVVASTSPSEEGKSKIGYPYFDHGRNDLYLQRPYMSKDLKAPAMTAAIPLRAADGRVVAVLAGRMDLAALSAIVLHRTGLRQSEDAFLLNDDRFPVTQPRFLSEPVVLRRQLDTEAVRRCAARNSGVVLAADYRGVPTINVYRWNAKRQLGLIVKIDQAEALAPVRAFGRSVILISSLALLAAAGLAFLLARTITGPLRALHAAVQKFGDGDWQARVKISATDELGEVAGAWNGLIDRLARQDKERTQAEETLRESEVRFSGAFEHAPIGVALLSPDGHWLKVNRAICHLVGYSEDELLTSTFQDITHPEDLPADLEHVRQLLAGDIFTYQMEKRYVHAQGHLVTALLNVSLVRDGHGQPLYFISQIQDITDRKRAEKELRFNEQRYRSLVEATTAIVWDTPASGMFEVEQPRWEAFTGQSFKEYLGWGWLDAIHPDDQAETARVWNAAVATRSIYEVEHRMRRHDRIFRNMSVRAVPIVADDGKILQWIGVHTDITERKQAEDELERVHKELVDLSRQAGMSEIATSVLHNVGNVLNSVNVSADMLADHVGKMPVADLGRVVALLREHDANLGAFFTEDPRGPKLPEFLGKLAAHFSRVQETQLKEVVLLQKNVEHIKEIVAMQQSYARVSGVTESLQMTDLVEDALRIHGGAFQRHAVQVVREFAPGLPAINTERHKVLQILVNLLGNARHACDSAGHGEKRLTVRVSHADGRMRVEVSDNGVGIPAENLDRIFNHGFTTKKDGHGFGLHSAANAAGEMGGSLTVHSDGPGKGATFTLELPVNERAGTPPAIDATHTTPPLHA